MLFFYAAVVQAVEVQSAVFVILKPKPTLNNKCDKLKPDKYIFYIEKKTIKQKFNMEIFVFKVLPLKSDSLLPLKSNLLVKNRFIVNFTKT